MDSTTRTPVAGSTTYHNPQQQMSAPESDLHTMIVNRISWGAVLAGVVLMLSANIILNMIGAGIGAATIDPLANNTPSLSSFSMGAGIWWSVSGIIASFIGATIAARLCGSPKPSTGALHGLTAWALMVLLMVYLFGAAAQSVAGGAFSTISTATAGMGRSLTSVAQSAAPNLTAAADPFSSIEQSIRANGNDPAALRDGAIAAVRAVVTGDQGQAAQARERAAEALARAQNIPLEDARSRVAQYEQQYRQAAEQIRQTATQAADATARAVSRTTLLASLALLLGAVAAWFGGRAGVVDPERNTVQTGVTGASRRPDAPASPARS